MIFVRADQSSPFRSADDDSPPGAPAKTKRSKSLDLGDPIPFRLDASEKSGEN